MYDIEFHFIEINKIIWKERKAQQTSMESDNFKRWKKVNINQGREEDKYHKSGDRQDT